MGVSGNDDVETLEKLPQKDESFCMACGERDVLGGAFGGSRAKIRPHGYEAKIRSNGGIEDGRAGCRASWCGQNDVGRKWLADFTGRRRRKGCFLCGVGADVAGACWPTSEAHVLEAAGAPGDRPRLRAAVIAAHLRGFRGMEVHPDQIVIGSGAQSLWSARALLDRDLVYGVEDPGYPRLQYLPVERCGGAADRPRGRDVVGGS